MKSANDLSPEDFLLLSKQRSELQKITESQSQQLSILQRRIEEISSYNIHLSNQNDELRAKCSEHKSNEVKVAVIREALTRDFCKLRDKMN
jgi:predicted Rossmann fold nucleotide-binding protein DprA/Smf involved in DNA uptake